MLKFHINILRGSDHSLGKHACTHACMHARLHIMCILIMSFTEINSTHIVGNSKLCYLQYFQYQLLKMTKTVLANKIIQFGWCIALLMGHEIYSGLSPTRSNMFLKLTVQLATYSFQFGCYIFWDHKNHSEVTPHTYSPCGRVIMICWSLRDTHLVRGQWRAAWCWDSRHSHRCKCSVPTQQGSQASYLKGSGGS